MTLLNTGDRVRVTYTMTVDDPHAYEVLRDTSADFHAEVIERADDPANDPIGTVRVEGKVRYIRLNDVGTCDWFDLYAKCYVSSLDIRKYAESKVIGNIFDIPVFEETKPKLRAFKDCDRDRWFEVKPDVFVISSTRESAERLNRVHGGGRSLEALFAEYGPLDELDEGDL